MDQSDEMFLRDVTSNRSQPLQMEKKTTLTDLINMAFEVHAYTTSGFQ